jgi:hypothetical protein
MQILVALGWPVAAWLFLQWRCAQHEAEGWRYLFELHHVDPTRKTH